MPPRTPTPGDGAAAAEVVSQVLAAKEVGAAAGEATGVVDQDAVEVPMVTDIKVIKTATIGETEAAVSHHRQTSVSLITIKIIFPNNTLLNSIKTSIIKDQGSNSHMVTRRRTMSARLTMTAGK